MKNILILPTGITKSCHYASRFLQDLGFAVTDHLSPDITHLLLDIPSFDASGCLGDGTKPQELLVKLPESVTILGGNLEHPFLEGYAKIDLLKDSYFLAKNAAITAECAIRVASTYLVTTFTETPALILGWGRIGKYLARLLKSMGCSVTVAARKENDRAMLTAMGYTAIDYSQITKSNFHYRLLFNTVPVQIVHADILNYPDECIKIDLASAPGMVCDDVIVARGLPGKYAPKTTGKLIAESIHSIIQGVSI